MKKGLFLTLIGMIFSMILLIISCGSSEDYSDLEDSRCISPLTIAAEYAAKTELWAAIEDTIDPDGTINNSPDLRGLDTSRVTDMRGLFSPDFRSSNWEYEIGARPYLSDFNGDISTWDTSMVTDMYAMFYGATAFDQDIGTWDTSCSKSMASMFYGATSFDQNIGSWKTINVTSMLGILAMSRIWEACSKVPQFLTKT